MDKLLSDYALVEHLKSRCNDMKQRFEIRSGPLHEPLNVIDSPFMASLDADTRSAILNGISR